MGFWKGFSSLFDWMAPKSLDEQLDDLDNSMQDLYDRMGWGIYHHPFEYEEKQKRLSNFPSKYEQVWFE